MMIALPNIPGMPLWFYPYLIRVVIALPIAFFAKWKGYNFWVFFAVAALLDPLTCLVVLVIITRKTVIGEKEIEEIAG